MSAEIRNEGQRRLLERPESHAEVAAVLGCTKQVVSYWRRGTKRPGRANRAAIEEAFGIPPSAWSESPSDGAPAPPPPAELPPLSPIEHVSELLAEARRQRVASRLVPSEYAKAITTESRLIEQLERLQREERKAERERQMLEQRVVLEHPTWKRIEQLLEWLGERLPDELATEFEERLAAAVGG